MKKWLALVLVALIALASYVAAGPYLTVRAIRSAVQAQDAAALSRQIDFPALRASLKAQLLDKLVREAGADAQANPFGAFALTMASGMVNGAVDVMVTPTGLAGLMEGRKVWNNARDSFDRPQTSAEGQVPAREPLQDARYRYESLSRFTATVHDDSGKPLVFVMQRDGMRWRLADIRLPLGEDDR